MNLPVDWKAFEYKFSADSRAAFESLAYILFCYELKQDCGIFRYYNQPYIETQPVDTADGHKVGFQAKYYDAGTTVASREQELKAAIEGVKKNFDKEDIEENRAFSAEDRYTYTRWLADYVLDLPSDKQKKLIQNIMLCVSMEDTFVHWIWEIVACEMEKSRDIAFWNDKMPDKEVVWDTGMIRTILGRFEYTGALVMGRRHTVAVGSKVTRKTAERDVVIRKNINPPIITEEEYEVASASIMFMTKPEYRGAKDFLLKGKVRCGNCHRALAYTDGGIHPKIYCPHKAQAGRYSHCSEDAYPVSVIEGHIWYSLKRILRILDSVQRESEEKYTDNSFIGKRQQKVLESELEKLKNERIHQYEAYAEGVLSREKYITVKKQLTEKIEEIQSEQKALASVIIEEERYRSRIRTAVQQLEVQIERGKLTKEIIDTMIDTVYVYDKKRIEVILRFDDVLQKVISEYMEGAKGA